MEIRPGTASDLAACAGLDASYTTDYTWQIAADVSSPASPDELVMRFRIVRLPRQRAVVQPAVLPELGSAWDRFDLFIVAAGQSPAGYLLAAEVRRRAAVAALVVDKPHRRAGLGTRMLAGAVEWARSCGLRGVVAPVPLRNYPAISFLRSRGFRVSGYNESHYDGRDIAVYLALDFEDA